MKTNKIIAVVMAGILSAPAALAGNKDRVGSAGATELLINPYARSSSWGSAGVSCVDGIEATFINVAGLAFTPKTEVTFIRTNYLSGSGVKMNSMGLAQRVSETSVLGLTMTTMNFGENLITTVDLPEGGVGYFTPRYVMLGLSYAKEFSRSIYGGFTVKTLTESISNLKTNGVAIDAGIRYVSGEKDQIKFGITLKNVGPPMTYQGDGFAVFSEFLSGSTTGTGTTQQRSAKFEIPSLVNIGASYDFLFGETQKLTAAIAFTSNSFSKDQFRFGANYNYNHKKAAFNAYARYVLEQGQFDKEAGVTSAFSGPSLGFSADLKNGEDKSRICIDYGFRFTTTQFSGTHSIGLRIAIN